jgi:hypothetical protein
MTTERGDAPSPTHIEFENLIVWWVEQGIALPEARLLAFFQYTGGNAFGLVDCLGQVYYAPRPEA